MRYLARRPKASMRWPVSLAAKFSGKGKRRSARRSSTRNIRAPTIAGSRPRRTVSTSGSSGKCAFGGAAGIPYTMELLIGGLDFNPGRQVQGEDIPPHSLGAYEPVR